jgi:hypothetical protein
LAAQRGFAASYFAGEENGALPRFNAIEQSLKTFFMFL